MEQITLKFWKKKFGIILNYYLKKMKINSLDIQKYEQQYSLPVDNGGSYSNESQTGYINIRGYYMEFQF